MIRYLVEKGASLDLINNDKDKKTPIDLLELTYREAKKIVNNTVIVFLLDEQEFNENLAPIKEFLTSKGLA